MQGCTQEYCYPLDTGCNVEGWSSYKDCPHWKPGDAGRALLKSGARAICKMCGKEIIYIGPYWDHAGEMKPRHPALPKESET